MVLIGEDEWKRSLGGINPGFFGTTKRSLASGKCLMIASQASVALGASMTATKVKTSGASDSPKQPRSTTLPVSQ